jgi:hypothetical protein
MIMFPIVAIIMHNRKREYDCRTLKEIEALRRYQAITDIVCPDGEWEDDYSWVQ